MLFEALNEMRKLAGIPLLEAVCGPCTLVVTKGSELHAVYRASSLEELADKVHSEFGDEDGSSAKILDAVGISNVRSMGDSHTGPQGPEAGVWGKNDDTVVFLPW